MTPSKKTMADTMIEQACQLYPQIRDHIDYIEIGTPVTNSHYLAQPHGEIYGLDHGYGRFDSWLISDWSRCVALWFYWRTFWGFTLCWSGSWTKCYGGFRGYACITCKE